MVTVSLQQSLLALYGPERHGGLHDLDGTRKLLEALGRPQDRFDAVHVAGTNGKGSVCALIERVLREAGVRTGLFTSPHLVDFRERMRVAGQWAEEAWLTAAIERLSALPESQGRTFFEMCTALGFESFAARGVEWAVVEVGLGGRLDSTNVLDPKLTVITSIGLDHTEILGDTLEAVAAEKAGILKPGVPLVSGVTGEPRAQRVIEKAARARDVPVLRAGHGSLHLEPSEADDAPRFLRSPVYVRESRPTPEGLSVVLDGPRWGRLEVTTGLRGRHQLSNLVIAVDALALLPIDLPPEALEHGFAKAQWPGRLEPAPTEPRLWWDGAHNREGVQALLEAWSKDLALEPPGAVVLALSRDKDAARILAAIAARFPRTRLVATRSKSERALGIDAMLEIASKAGLVAEGADDVPSAVRRALALAGSGRALLTGSLFAVGEAMEAFGGAPGEWL